MADRDAGAEEQLLSGYSGRLFLILTLGYLVVTMGRRLLPPLLPEVIGSLGITTFGAGVVLFEKETLLNHEGPTPSRAKELIGWPGIAEASAIAGGREHELTREKERFEEAVTVAVGR